MKILSSLLLAFCLVSAAQAFEISEETLNEHLVRKLAEKPRRDVQLLDPKIRLQEGFARFCARAHTRLLAQDVDFCADMTPLWRQETGSLLATRMALVSLEAPGISEKQVDTLRMLMNQLVLPRLDGVEVYKTDSLIGRQVSSVQVLPGKLNLGFW